MKSLVLSLSIFASSALAQDQCGYPTSVHQSGFESGEQVSSVTLPADNTPLVVTINGPADGATVNINAVQFYGTYTGPSNSGVSANGVRGLTNANAFVLPRVLLTPGPNVVTFRTATLDAAPVTSVRTINYVSAPSNVLFTANSPGDYAPTTMPFTLSTALPANQTTVTRVQIDYNGDGTFEVDSPAPIPLLYAYEAPGLFVATARITFDDGNTATPPVVINDSTRVLIQSMAFTRQTLCGLYASMKTRLGQNQIPSALNTLSPALKPQFQALWTALNQSSQLTLAASRLGVIVDGQLSRNSAELRVAVPTVVPGTFKGFIVLFRRDISGVWRIERM
jgi:hypothetical protein